VSYTSHDSESDPASAPGHITLETLRALSELAKWREQSNCIGKRSLFFAPNSERPQARIRREAKAGNLCKCCPAQTPCRKFARENHEYGFWGGENEEQRHLAGYKVIAPIGIRAKVIRPPHQNSESHY
jgi:WhiB family redox-sensing transcriptional regulator